MDTTRNCPECRQPLSPDAPDGLCPQCLMKAAAGPPPNASSDGLPGDIIDIGDPAEVAKKLPQFEILDMLGRGGMGVVYQARQRNLDRIVALKILPPVDALSADFVARFSREARALAKLNHPNIVSVYDFGETGGLYYIVMEYVEGANLRQLFEARKLTPAEALAIVPKICDALEYAHEEGLVHRDIKPENLLIDKKGRVKIADFGLAKLLRREPLDMTLTLSGMTLGTMRYMAPEQMDKPETVDHRADLYSLGVVIYEMLTGETPVGRFELPSQKAQVDVRFDEIVLHALEKEPERRYQHASEVKTDVEKVASTPRGAPIPKSKPDLKSDLPPDIRRAVKTRRAFAFGGLLLAVAVACAILILPESFRPTQTELFRPKSANYQPGSYQMLQLVCWVDSNERGRTVFNQQPKEAWVSVIFEPNGDPESWRTLVVHLPGMNAEYFPNAGPGTSKMLLDLESLLQWMHNEATLDTNNAEVRTEGQEIFALLKRYALAPPGSFAAFDQSAKEELTHFNFSSSYAKRFSSEELTFFVSMLVGVFIAYQWVVFGIKRRGVDVAVAVASGAAPGPLAAPIAGALLVAGIGAFGLLFAASYGFLDISGTTYGDAKAALPTMIVATVGVAALLVSHYFGRPSGVRASLPLFTLIALGVAAGALPWPLGKVAVPDPRWASASPWHLELSGWRIWHGVAFSLIYFALALMHLIAGGEKFARLRAASLLATGLAGLGLVCNCVLSPPSVVRGIVYNRHEYLPVDRVFESIELIGWLALITVVLGAVQLRQALAAKPQVEPPASTGPATMDERILETLRQDKIAAIRLHRELTGSSLAEAKAAVELVAQIHGVPDPAARKRHLPHAVTLLIVTMAALAMAVGSNGVPSIADNAVALAGIVVILVLLIRTVCSGRKTRQGESSNGERPDQPRRLRYVVLTLLAVLGCWGWMGRKVLFHGAIYQFALRMIAPFEAPIDPPPPLGTITGGIGATFTVPAGQVATFEIVTRSNNATVPISGVAAYVLAPPSSPVAGTFRWSPEAEDMVDPEGIHHKRWKIELVTGGGKLPNGSFGGGKNSGDVPILPKALESAVGARSYNWSLLPRDRETIDWAVSQETDDLPANGLVGFRVRTQGYEPEPGRGVGPMWGTGSVDWQKGLKMHSITEERPLKPASSAKPAP